jgi:hypothetical protein
MQVCSKCKSCLYYCAASKWCTVGSASFEQWRSSDCSGTSMGWNKFTPEQCFASQVDDKSNVKAHSFSCAASFVPTGQWYSTVSYADSKCENAVMANTLRNKYCHEFSGFSSFIDYPDDLTYVWPYQESTNCSTSVPMWSDLSKTAGQCVAASSGSIQSTMSTFSQL